MKWLGEYINFVNNFIKAGVGFFLDSFKGCCAFTALFMLVFMYDMGAIHAHGVLYNVFTLVLDIGILWGCVGAMKKFPEYEELWK